MCKISFFERAGAPYVAVASKNVTCVLSASSAAAAEADAAAEAYGEKRFTYALEMARTFAAAYLRATRTRCPYVRDGCNSTTYPYSLESVLAPKSSHLLDRGPGGMNE